MDCCMRFPDSVIFCRAVPLRIYEVSSGFEYLRKEKMQEHVSQRDPSI